MARVPNAANAIVEPRKITHYLLSGTSAKGAPKATFFEWFGFRRDQPDVLAVALLAHIAAHQIDKVLPSPWGLKYEISGPMPAPDGRVPTVRTVWIVNTGTTVPRFVTAVPD
jgi:hypothetical protein